MRISCYIFAIKEQEVPMKKTATNPIDLYCNALKGMTLAANMLVLTALCCTDDKECDGLEELTTVCHHFDTALHKALENKMPSSSTVITTAKRYFSALKDFKKSPDAQTDEIQELLKDQEEIIQSIIYPER